MSRHTPSRPASLPEQPIAVGATAEIYAWENGLIVKLFRDRFSAADVQVEARTARLIYASGAPAPAVGEIVEINGRIGLVYERIVGVSMLAALTAQPWRLVVLARRLAGLQADLHAIPAPAGLPVQHRRMRDRIQETPILPPEQRQQALALFDRLPSGSQLCHGDFHPDNVLLTANGPVIIDWIDATAGHPLADTARTSMLLTMAQPAVGASLGWAVRLLRAWFHRSYLAHYHRLHPYSKSELARWRLVNAAARLSEGAPEEQALVQFLQAEFAVR